MLKQKVMSKILPLHFICTLNASTMNPVINKNGDPVVGVINWKMINCPGKVYSVALCFCTALHRLIAIDDRGKGAYLMSQIKAAQSNLLKV